MKQTLFCGGPAVAWRNWLPFSDPSADLASTSPQFRNRTVIGTYRGRSAIALACRLLGIGPGHEVLVPAYNCGTEIDAILHSGAHTVGYSVSRRCEIDLSDLKTRITDRTRAVYVIHYFGWEQPMEQMRRWCNEQGLFLIEDCALALFSTGASGAIGWTGDAAIYSLPKTLGFCHGGLLTLPPSRALAIPSLTPAGFPVLFQEIFHSGKTAFFKGLDLFHLWDLALSARQRLRPSRPLPNTHAALPDMPADYYFRADADADRALHPRAYVVAGAFSCEEIIQRRRRNYQRLAAALAPHQGLQPLFSTLPDGVCPLSLPVLASNRDVLVATLQSRGISAMPWWAGFHHGSLKWSEFPDACWLKHHLLTLPVHQELNNKQVDYVAETVTRVAGTPQQKPRLNA